MNNQISKIKSENRKQLKRFMLIVFIAALLGAATECIVERFCGNLQNLYKYFNMVLIYIIPYSICITGITAFIICFLLYRKSKKLYENCHEENEELINKVESINGYSMIINNINLILSFFFFGAGVVLKNHVSDMDNQPYKGVVFLVSYIINFVIIIIMQQKQVDFEKILNPEKKGSVYDIKFAKKWEDSCDELERLIIYKSSFKAFKVTQRACILIWVILILINTVWDIGIIPILIITVIWAILTCSYSIEAMKLQKNSNRK